MSLRDLPFKPVGGQPAFERAARSAAERCVREEGRGIRRAMGNLLSVILLYNRMEATLQDFPECEFARRRPCGDKSRLARIIRKRSQSSGEIRSMVCRAGKAGRASGERADYPLSPTRHAGCRGRLSAIGGYLGGVVEDQFGNLAIVLQIGPEA